MNFSQCPQNSVLLVLIITWLVFGCGALDSDPTIYLVKDSEDTFHFEWSEAPVTSRMIYVRTVDTPDIADTAADIEDRAVLTPAGRVGSPTITAFSVGHYDAFTYPSGKSGTVTIAILEYKDAANSVLEKEAYQVYSDAIRNNPNPQIDGDPFQPYDVGDPSELSFHYVRPERQGKVVPRREPPVDADGFILMVDEEEVYRQFQGAETGGISLKVGDELDVHVVFIDHDSEEVSFEEDHHDEEEEDGHGHDEEEAFGLALSEYDTSIIEIHLPEDHEEEDEHHDEEFAFEVIGVRAGQTGIKLELMHGDHPDFTAALPIPVTVSP